MVGVAVTPSPRTNICGQPSSGLTPVDRQGFDRLNWRRAAQPAVALALAGVLAELEPVEEVLLDEEPFADEPFEDLEPVEPLSEDVLALVVLSEDELESLPGVLLAASMLLPLRESVR